MSGLALAATLRRPAWRVRGAEAEASPAVSRSVAAGHTVTVPIGTTLADGLAGNLEPGSVTVGLIARGVEEVAGVDEESIASAVRFLAFGHGLVVEPSGAVAVAALLSGRLPRDRGRRSRGDGPQRGPAAVGPAVGR